MLSDAKAIVSKEMSGKMQLWYLITLHAVSVSVTLNIDSHNNTSQTMCKTCYWQDKPKFLISLTTKSYLLYFRFKQVSMPCI